MTCDGHFSRSRAARGNDGRRAGAHGDRTWNRDRRRRAEVARVVGAGRGELRRQALDLALGCSGSGDAEVASRALPGRQREGRRPVQGTAVHVDGTPNRTVPSVIGRFPSLTNWAFAVNVAPGWTVAGAVSRT